MADIPTPPRRDALFAAGAPSAVRVFTALLTRGVMTRAELGDCTGFSPGGVTKALRPLLDAGLVRELPEQWSPSGAGRPALPLRVEAEHSCVIGIKITADEVIAVLTDLRARVLDTRHAPLPTIIEPGHHARTVDPDDAIAAIGTLVQVLLAAHPQRASRVARMGIAVSGDVDSRAGMVRFSPLLGWRGISLAERVSRLTGLVTTIENDVRSLTVAEQWFGIGVDNPSFALVTVGTGVGCGLIVNGALVAGAHGVAGEIGHLPLDPRGPECHCGGTGCVEALIGEAALLDRVAAVARTPVASMAEAVALVRLRAVRKIFADAGRVLGLALATIANLLGPQRIVLSGETLEAYDLFAPTMIEAFEAQCFGAAQQCEIVVRPLQFEHWARGAAAVAIARMVTATA